MKQPKVSVQYRMDEQTHAKLKVISAAEKRSLNSQIDYFVLKGIEAFEKDHGRIPEEAEEE